MKNLAVILFIFCAVNTLTGQPSKQNLKYKDSLQYYYDLANHPQSPFDLANAYKFYNEKQKLSSAKKDTLTAIKYLRQIAIIQLKLGDYYGSESSEVEALRYLEAMKQTDFTRKNKLGLYNELGGIYKERMDYDLALKYFNKGLELAQTKAENNIIKNNMALVYNKQLQFEKSETLLSEVYKNSIILGDSVQLARALDNLGFVEGKLNRPDALDHMKQALNMRLTRNDQLGTYASYKHLSQYFMDQNDYEKAQSYAQKAYNISKQIQSTSYLEDALDNLISTRPNTIEYQYKKLKDSIETAKKLAENKYALMKFDYLNQRQIASTFKIQKEKEHLKSLLFRTLVVIIMVVVALILSMLYSKNQRDRLQEIYLTETRISKKLHDEVANDVYQVMTQLESDIANKDKVLDALEDIYSRTRDISKENSSIALNENFEEVLKDLLMRYHTNKVNVITRNLSKIDWNAFESFKKITLYRILQELMVNMKKHSNATIVAITFRSKGKKLTINYSDNGVGCQLKKLSGLRNVENRMVTINGSAIFDSKPGQGFKAKISM
ncbi:tetratricopeptide repeat-containing sensor histidine kinase [Gaetbulibacter aestuarii]|uniref:histidine kinase n=1 Tax=Gaetbulibacter aestuarii TaxID=1502358 RepID=A0ABW7MYH5_9FLAO